VVLLDKVEATEYLLCGPDSTCPTIPTTRLTTTFHTTTTPSTAYPTTPLSGFNRTIILETFIDEIANPGWISPSALETPECLEYYNDTYQFLNPSGSDNLRADAFKSHSVPARLNIEPGIWVACKDLKMPVEECFMSPSLIAPCHPFISFMDDGLKNNEAIGKIQIVYFFMMREPLC